MRGLPRILVALASLMGTAGVGLAAVSAHQPDATRLLAAGSSMLLFHACAVLGTLALAERAMVQRSIGLAAAFGFVVAPALFAGDLALRRYAGHGLFPFAAPAGGTLMILSWLLLGLAAVWPHEM